MNNQQDTDYYLPNDTARLLMEKGIIKDCKNLGLILDKYPKKTVFPQKDEDKKNKDGKSVWLRTVVSDKHVDTDLAKAAYQRWLTATTAVGAEHFTAVTDWRMVVGLGGETVLETDLTLHHVYGIPFIPGSALKGLTRAYVTGEVEVYKSDNIDNDHKDVKRIFGSQEHAGTVIFFDAMPVDGEVTFALDIMNPHYPDYYGGEEPPTNDQNPKPIPFLTVTKTTFKFALAPRRPESVQDVQLVKLWLQKALKDYGVGGKTSAGYGYFTEIPDAQASTAPSLSAQKAISPLIKRKQVELPTFQINQEIMGVVVTQSQHNHLSQHFSSFGSGKFLTYRDFRNRDYSAEDIIIFVSAEHSEIQAWTEKGQRKCQIVQIEDFDTHVVLVCRPKPSKNKQQKR